MNEKRKSKKKKKINNTKKKKKKKKINQYLRFPPTPERSSLLRTMPHQRAHSLKFTLYSSASPPRTLNTYYTFTVLRLIAFLFAVHSP